jgi:SAM-dependent methyltransferase
MARSFDELWRTSWGAASSGGPGFRSRHAVLMRLLTSAGVAGRLLDFGAGDGALLERIAARFPWLELSACERSGEARSRLAARELPVTLLDALPDAPAFDVVICSEVLEHVQDDEALLGQLAGALAPGGLLALTVPLRADLWTRVDDAVGHLRRYEPGQLAGMCRRLGLDVEVDLAFGFPLYNTYYRLLGRKQPRGGDALDRPGASLLTGLLAAALAAEAGLPSRRGGRGVLLARKGGGRR